VQPLINRLTGASCCQCGGAWGDPWGGSSASVTSPSPLQSHTNASQWLHHKSAGVHAVCIVMPGLSVLHGGIGKRDSFAASQHWCSVSCRDRYLDQCNILLTMPRMRGQMRAVPSQLLTLTEHQTHQSRCSGDLVTQCTCSCTKLVTMPIRCVIRHQL